MITNESGEVAIKYRNPTPRIEGDYAFVVKYHLSIAFVSPAFAEVLVRRRGNCRTCSKHLFTFASEAEVNHWLWGNPRRTGPPGCDTC